MFNSKLKERKRLHGQIPSKNSDAMQTDIFTMKLSTSLETKKRQSWKLKNHATTSMVLPNLEITRFLSNSSSLQEFLPPCSSKELT
jgi:hypothetical protein